MGNIYIEVDEDFRVTKVHRMPFDPNNGMGYTREELEKKGFFVDEIPEPVHQVGRRSIMMYNPDIKSIYYEYVGIPMSDKERVEQAENAVNALLNIIYGQQVSTMSLSSENEEVQEDPNTKAIGEYLAYQIISGKMDIQETLHTYPQCESVIKEILADNGIQA